MLYNGGEVNVLSISFWNQSTLHKLLIGDGIYCVAISLKFNHSTSPVNVSNWQKFLRLGAYKLYELQFMGFPKINISQFYPEITFQLLFHRWQINANFLSARGDDVYSIPMKLSLQHPTEPLKMFRIWTFITYLVHLASGETLKISSEGKYQLKYA